MYKKITRTVVEEIHHDHDGVADEIETTTTTEMYPTDTIAVNIPLMLSILEHVKEAQPTDNQIHAMVQKLVELCNAEEYDTPLSMDHLEQILMAAKEINGYSEPAVPAVATPTSLFRPMA